MVELGNITLGKVATTTAASAGGIKQWVIPSLPAKGKSGLPPASTISEIARAFKRFSPEIIHVWGTEYFWGLLTARRILDMPALLETQGLKSAISRVFAGGLSFPEKLACIGIKELLRRSTIFDGERQFRAWGEFEREMIANHSYISVQTDWLEAQIRATNTKAEIFRTDFMLRELFNNCSASCAIGSPVVFCSAAYSSPFKGLHVAVRAIAIVKKRFQNIQLVIAGAHRRPGIRRDGYIAWVEREISRLGLVANIQWAGPMCGLELMRQMRKSGAFLSPSFVEGYNLALAEAMSVGVPAVVSYAGGSACLARDGESALFFSPGDEAMCAFQLERVLSEKEMALRLSHRAREIALVRNNPQRVLEQQLEIYRRILESKQKL